MTINFLSNLNLHILGKREIPGPPYLEACGWEIRGEKRFLHNTLKTKSLNLPHFNLFNSFVIFTPPTSMYQKVQCHSLLQ